MEKAYLVLVDGQGASPEKLMHPLFSNERQKKIARCKTEGQRIDSACAELAYLLAFKRAFGEVKKDQYAYGQNNKPYFREMKYGCLSIAHAGGIGACLIAPIACGVDIEEKTRDVKRIDQKIRFKTGRETADTLTLWCAKESYVKCTGEGLSRPFSALLLMDGSMLDEDGKELAWVKTGEIGRAFWAASLDKEMEISVLLMKAEEAVRFI